MQKGFDDFLHHLGCQLFPLDFGNSVTTSEFLQELYSYIKNVNDSTGQLRIDLYNDFTKKFDELSDKLINDDEILLKYKEQIKDYCTNYMNYIIGDSLNYISFGLTDDGYFYADIPDNMANLHFDTIVDNESEDYGKLILEY